MRSSWHAIWLASTLVASTALAQSSDEELILDPENPAVETPDQPEKAASEPEDEQLEAPDDSGDEMTILDPENPAVETGDTSSLEGEAGQSTGGFSYDEPEESGFQTATFLGSYATESRLDLGFDDHEDIFEQLNSLKLRLEFDPSAGLSVVLEAEFTHWWSFEQGLENPAAAYDARLLDAYVLWRDGRFSLAVGNLVTTWGSTDLIRPADVVNPVDLTDISGSGALEKIPQFTVDATYSGDDWSVQGLLVPFFVPNRVWLFGRDTAPLSARADSEVQTTLLDLSTRLVDQSRVEEIQPVLLSTSEPDEGPQSFSAGARLTATAANTDFGLGYFFGWDRTPFLRVDEDLREFLEIAASDPDFRDDFDLLGLVSRNSELVPRLQSIQAKAARGESLFESKYLRQHTVEADAARFFGPVGVRADAVFQHSRTFVTSDLSSVARPTFSGALGLSYERLVDEKDSLIVTVEGFAIHALAADAPLTEALIPAERRGSSDAELILFEDTTFGVATAISWSIPAPELQIQLGGISLLKSADLIASASIGRQWESWLRTSLTALFFENLDNSDDLTIGRLYDRNDYIGLEVSGVF